MPLRLPVCLPVIARSGRWLSSILGAIALLAGGAAAIAQGSDEVDTLAPQDAMFQTLLTLPSNYGVEVGFGTDRDNRWPVLRSTDTDLFEPTLPNLWWSRDQLPNRWQSTDNSVLRLDGYRLVRDWTAFRSQTASAHVVDILVDPQYWNRFNYYQKYAILNQFGTTGMSYGHHVRIYSSINLVGVHTCDFTQVPEFTTATPTVEVPIPNLSNVNCTAAVGPFIDYSNPVFLEDLFAPP
jgi:hypothetical protein